jgi:hypothetical protein
MMDLSKTRTEITVHNIMSTLILLRDGATFDNLDWLHNVDAVLEQIKLRSKTDGTMRTHIARVMTVLGDHACVAQYKAIFDECKEREKAQVESHKKTEPEKEKLVAWNRVMEVRETYKALSDAITPRASPKEHEIQQIYLLLLLFTEFPPRRNDYAYMDIVGPMSDAKDTKRNYYVADTQQFVFNNYKTKAQYSQQIFDVPDMIAEAILRIRGPHWEAGSLPLFVNQKGTRINSVSTQTIWLTKAFGSPMGTSALRHIVLAKEFPTLVADMEKRKFWAERMAHSLGQQVDYIKVDE